MQSNRQDEKSRANIPNVNQPPLSEAFRRRSHEFVLPNPIPGEDETERLLEIRKQEVVNKDKYLVFGDGTVVESLPVYHSVGDEDDKTECRRRGQESKDAHCNHSISNIVGQWVEGGANVSVGSQRIES